MESVFESLASRLHLPLNNVQKIKRDYYYSCQLALNEVINDWVLMKYKYAIFGKPSWKLLVVAVHELDSEKAKRIASRHKKVCMYVYSL